MFELQPHGWVLNSDSMRQVRHGFFTRRGGVSQPPYDTLNCSPKSGDLSHKLQENRARVASYLKVQPSHLLGVTQIHSSEVVVVRPSSQLWCPSESPAADAIVTDRTDIAIGVITADCAPVIFTNAEGSIVGVAHAGWRGAVQGILEATLVTMRQLGAREVMACVGPCISAESYEVGQEMRDYVVKRSPGAHSCFTVNPRSHRLHFDLRRYCFLRLRQAGLNRLSSVQLDTCRDSMRFFSHRRRVLAGGGAIGHQMSALRAGVV